MNNDPRKLLNLYSDRGIEREEEEQQLPFSAADLVLLDPSLRASATELFTLNFELAAFTEDQSIKLSNYIRSNPVFIEKLNRVASIKPTSRVERILTKDIIKQEATKFSISCQQPAITNIFDYQGEGDIEKCKRHIQSHIFRYGKQKLIGTPAFLQPKITEMPATPEKAIPNIPSNDDPREPLPITNSQEDDHQNDPFDWAAAADLLDTATGGVPLSEESPTDEINLSTMFPNETKTLEEIEEMRMMTTNRMFCTPCNSPPKSMGAIKKPDPDKRSMFSKLKEKIPSIREKDDHGPVRETNFQLMTELINDLTTEQLRDTNFAEILPTIQISNENVQFSTAIGLASKINKVEVQLVNVSSEIAELRSDMDRVLNTLEVIQAKIFEDSKLPGIITALNNLGSRLGGVENKIEGVKEQLAATPKHDFVPPSYSCFPSQKGMTSVYEPTVSLESKTAVIGSRKPDLGPRVDLSKPKGKMTALEKIRQKISSQGVSPVEPINPILSQPETIPSFMPTKPISPAPGSIPTLAVLTKMQPMSSTQQPNKDSSLENSKAYKRAVEYGYPPHQLLQDKAMIKDLDTKRIDAIMKFFSESEPSVSISRLFRSLEQHYKEEIATNPHFCAFYSLLSLANDREGAMIVLDLIKEAKNH